MKKITFVSQFPPPIHGLSKAVDTLYHSQLKNIFRFEAIDITSNKSIFKTLWKLLISRTDVFYFTISQTKMGLWRDLVLMKLMEWKNKPLIIHLHGGYLRKLIDNDCNALQRKLAYKVIGNANSCIVLGNSLKYIFEGIVSDERIKVVPNCADDEYVMPNVTEKLHALSRSNCIHILYLSNFIVTKGYREVLDVAKRLKERGDGDKFMFHFAGMFFDEKEKAYFESYIENNKLQCVVNYHGIVSGDAKVALLQQCNIFMLLTRYPNEGQPISILEAMGNGMAIVTTNHAGIPDIVQLESGFVCSKENISIETITTFLLKCYEDRKILIKMCMYNHKVALKCYTQQQYIDSMKSIFISAI